MVGRVFESELIQRLMKITYPLLLLCSIPLGRISAAGLSETNSGIYIAIAGTGSGPERSFVADEPIRFDDRLLWCPFSKIGPVEVKYPDRIFWIRVKMAGPDGKDVKKSSLGEGLGKKFDEVRNYADVATGWTIGGITAYGDYEPRGGGFTGGPPLPSPKEMFEMEAVGIYTLQIEFQCFLIDKKTNPWQRKLIRFAPVRIKVEKPEPKK